MVPWMVRLGPVHVLGDRGVCGLMNGIYAGAGVNVE